MSARRYTEGELLDRLAADWITGGMAPAAARRAQQLHDTVPEFREAVRRWQSVLDASLLDTARQPSIPESVWQGVHARIDRSGRRPGDRGASAWRRLAWLASAVAAASTALAVALLLRGPGAAAPAQAELTATLGGTQGVAGVVLLRRAAVTFASLEGVRPPPGKSYELWLIPRHGRPIALAVAEPGRTDYAIPAAARAALAQTQAVAISVEPIGGSPTGQPTGPVVYSGPVHGT